MAIEGDKNPLKLDVRLSCADREEKLTSYFDKRKEKIEGWEATTCKYCVTVLQ